MRNLTIVITIALVLIGAVYSLNRGIYIGSEAWKNPSPFFSYRPWYLRCEYLVASGIALVPKGGHRSAKLAAEFEHCSLFMK